MSLPELGSEEQLGRHPQPHGEEGAFTHYTHRHETTCYGPLKGKIRALSPPNGSGPLGQGHKKALGEKGSLSK